VAKLLAGAAIGTLLINQMQINQMRAPHA